MKETLDHYSYYTHTECTLYSESYKVKDDDDYYIQQFTSYYPGKYTLDNNSRFCEYIIHRLDFYSNVFIELAICSNFFLDSVLWIRENSFYIEDDKIFKQSQWVHDIIPLDKIKDLSNEIERRIHSDDPDDYELLDMSFLPMYYIKQRIIKGDNE